MCGRCAASPRAPVLCFKFVATAPRVAMPPPYSPSIHQYYYICFVQTPYSGCCSLFFHSLFGFVAHCHYTRRRHRSFIHRRLSNLQKKIKKFQEKQSQTYFRHNSFGRQCFTFRLFERIRTLIQCFWIVECRHFSPHT